MDCKPIHAGSIPAAESIKQRMAALKAEYWAREIAIQTDCERETEHSDRELRGFGLLGRSVYHCRLCGKRFTVSDE